MELCDEFWKCGIQVKGLKKELVDWFEEVLRQEELQQYEVFDVVVVVVVVDVE